MEKQIEVKGQVFEKACQGCPCLLRFNWQRGRGRDVVYVVCGVQDCVKPVVEVK